MNFFKKAYCRTFQTVFKLASPLLPYKDPQILKTEDEVVEIGKKAYKVLDCKCLSRIDFIVDKKDGPMIIEVNTLPGMTDMSLFPDAARYMGIGYDDLVEMFLIYGLTTKRDF